MATVPVMDIPGVQGQQLPGVQIQTPQRLMAKADLGPGEQMRLGQAAGQFAGTMANETTMDQIQLNEAKAKEADAKLVAANQAVMYGSDDNPGSGYLNMKGKDAVDAFHDTVAKINANVVDAGSTLDNQAQQQLAQHTAVLRQSAALAQLKVHYDQQMNVYGDSVDQTRAKFSTDAAATSYQAGVDTPTLAFDNDNPGQNSPYQINLQGAVSAAKSYAARHGLDQDAAAQQAAAGVYAQTAQHLLNQGSGDPNQLAIAGAYFSAVKDSLPVPLQDRLAPQFQIADTQSKALALSISYGQKFDLQNDMAGAVEQLKDDFTQGKITADVYHAALGNLNADAAQGRQQNEQEQDQLWSQIAGLQQRNPNLVINQLPASILATLQQPGNGKLYEQVVKLLAPPDESSKLDDSAQYVDLRNMARDAPEQFATLPLDRMRGSLTPGHLEKLLDIQSGISKADVRTSAVERMYGSAVQSAREQIRAAGINLQSPKPGTPDAQNASQFEAYLHDQIDGAAALQPGKPLTDDQLTKITTDAIKARTVPGSGLIWDDSKMPYQMTPDERAKAYTPPPPGDAVKIRAALQKAGQPTDDETVQRIYNMNQGRYR